MPPRMNVESVVAASSATYRPRLSMASRRDDDGRVAGHKRRTNESTQQFCEKRIVFIELHGVRALPDERPVRHRDRGVRTIGSTAFERSRMH
jgi:hypothetical protein